MSILGDVYTVDNTLTGNPSTTDLDSLYVNELTANFINTVAGSKILNLANSTSDLQDQIDALVAGGAGSSPIVTVGTTTTLAAGSSATVTQTGSQLNPVLNFGIPQGSQGVAGITPNVTVGSTTTLAAGSSATVVRTGTTASPIFSFGIPQGIAGTTPNITIGSTTTLPAGSNALVVRTGTDANPVFSFSIPQGSQGIQGIAGITWKGIWSEVTLYAIGDAVSYFGTSFICISPAQGSGQNPVLSFYPPTSGNGYWQVLSDKGSQGQQGNKGDQGDEGDKGNTGDKGDKGDTGPAGGLDPVSALALAGVIADAAVITAKTINIAIPPATILGLTTFGGATIFTGAVTVGTPLTPAPFTAIGITTITGATTINGTVTMSSTLTVAAGITGIQLSTDYLYPLTGDTIQLTGVLQVLGSVNPYTVNTRNLIVKNHTETYNILEINPTDRTSVWKDGAGVNRFIIGTRPEVGGTEADNYFTCIADNIILGDITNTTAITINAPTITIGNEGTLLLIGNTCEDIFIGNNSFGEVTFGTVVLGFRSTNVEIGNNTVVVDIGAESTDLSIGLEAINVSLGTDAETINIGLHETAAISSTINIGKNETTTATPNTINIGTGTAYSNINIGSATDENALTTINGAVLFTGAVAFQAGGDPITLPDFINQMSGRIL
jgi:hypothetical protein